MAFLLFLAYLAATFIRPFELMPDLAQFNLMAILGGVVFMLALVSRAMGRSRLSAAPQLLLILLLVLWASFSVLVTQKWFTGAVDTIVVLSTNLFVFYLLVFNVDTLRRMRTTLHVLTALAVVVASESAAAYHFGYRSEELILYENAPDEPASLRPLGDSGAPMIPRVRHRGVLADPNDLAQALIALMPFVYLGREPGALAYNALRVWLPIALMVHTVFLTRSRGGLVTLIVLLFLVTRQRLNAVLSVILTGVGAVALVGLGFLAGRTAGVDGSTEGRTAAWREGWAMLKSSPIWGVGFGYFMEHHGRAAHNSFVECFAELGLVGYFVWLGTLVVTVWGLRQVAAAADSAAEVELHQLARAGLFSLVAFLVAAFFLSRAYQPILFVLLGLATAITDIARRRRILTESLSARSWVMQSVSVEIGSLLFLYVVMRLVP